jgi:hypothetical protein
MSAGMHVGRHRIAVTGITLALGAFLVLVTAALAGCGSGNTGERAPLFSGATTDGVSVSLSEYRGKPVVLAFMASW